MPEDPETLGVYHRHRIDSGLSHIESHAIRGERQPKGNLTPEVPEALVEVQKDVRNDGVLPNIDDRDRIVVAVAYEHPVVGRHQGVGAGPADRGKVFDLLTHQVSRLDSGDDMSRLGICHINAPDGEGFRHIGIAQARDFVPLHFHPFQGLRRPLAKGRKGDPKTGWVGVLIQAIEQRILVHAHVGHIRMRPVRRQGDSEWISTHRHARDYSAVCYSDDDHPEVGLIDGVECLTILAQDQVADIAVLEGLTADRPICVDLPDTVARDQVEEDDTTLLPTTHVERLAVRCDGQAHEHGGEDSFIRLHALRHLLHGGIRAGHIPNDGDRKGSDTRVGGDRYLAIRAEYEPVRMGSYYQRFASWREHSAVREHGGPIPVDGGIGIASRGRSDPVRFLGSPTACGQEGQDERN